MSSRRPSPTRYWSWLLAATIAAAASSAGAQVKRSPDELAGEGDARVGQAREHFNAGLALNAAGKVAEALVAFQTAYDLVPSWKILYNIGKTSRHVRDHARSLAAFKRYLAEGKDEVTRARRMEVEREIRTLESLVGRLEIRAPEGAEIAVDGVRQGTAPLPKAVLVNPGKHTVTAERAGARAASDVVVDAGNVAKMELSPEPETKPGEVAARSPDAAKGKSESPVSPPSDKSGYAKVAWIAAGVFAAGAAATGTIALIESEDLAASPYAGPDRLPAPDSGLRAQADRIDALAVVTDVLVGAAVVGAGLGLYFTLTSGPPAPARASGLSGPRPSSFSLRAAPAGAALEGTF